jgi:hypothetical protein
MCSVQFLKQIATVFLLSIFPSVVLSEIHGVLFELHIYVAYSLEFISVFRGSITLLTLCCTPVLSSLHSYLSKNQQYPETRKVISRN